MPTPQSTHLPHVSGDIVTVPAATGTLVVNTGLRNVQAITATLRQDAGTNAAADVSISVADAVAGRVKATIKVWKADGTTAASVAAKVSWIALGK